MSGNVNVSQSKRLTHPHANSTFTKFTNFLHLQNKKNSPSNEIMTVGMNNIFLTWKFNKALLLAYMNIFIN